MIIEYQNCEFSNPLQVWQESENSLTLISIDNENFIWDKVWNFSETNCITTNEMTEFISDNNSSSFYLTKDFSYGEIFLLFFLTIFTLFFIFGFILKFINKEKVSFRG